MRSFFRIMPISVLSVLVLIFFVTITHAADLRSLEQTLVELGRTLSSTTCIVSNVTELVHAVNQANEKGNLTILMNDGEYLLGDMLWIRGNNVTFRSRSGNRDAVIIRGEGMYGNITHIFDVSGTNFTVADVTIGWVMAHAIQIHGEHNADSPLIHNVRFVDTYQPLLNVSTDGGRYSSDHGIVEWCLFEYSTEAGLRDYIGGVDAHQASNWVVRNNVFRNITNQDNRLAGYAIRFSSESSDTVVENNVITNCDRGIGFGLERHAHLGGMIRNNMVHTTRDVSINLVNSRDTMVYNNTVYVN